MEYLKNQFQLNFINQSIVNILFNSVKVSFILLISIGVICILSQLLFNIDTFKNSF